MKIKLKEILLLVMIITNLLSSCGCNSKAEIERLPRQPNPAFWTGYQSDCPYYL
jgi:hypothetical protein